MAVIPLASKKPKTISIGCTILHLPSNPFCSPYLSFTTYPSTSPCSPFHGSSRLRLRVPKRLYLIDRLAKLASSISGADWDAPNLPFLNNPKTQLSSHPFASTLPTYLVPPPSPQSILYPRPPSIYPIQCCLCDNVNCRT